MALEKVHGMVFSLYPPAAVGIPANSVLKVLFELMCAKKSKSLLFIRLLMFKSRI